MRRDKRRRATQHHGRGIPGGYRDVALAYRDSDHETIHSLYDLSLTPTLHLVSFGDAFD